MEIQEFEDSLTERSVFVKIELDDNLHICTAPTPDENDDDGDDDEIILE